MASGALSFLSGAWWATPEGAWGAADEDRRLARGCSFPIKRISPRGPQERFSGGMASSQAPYPLAAARRAPAHSFRCSSFSHRKTLRWEPCDFPSTTPLKRPKEGLRPFLWEPSWGLRGIGGCGPAGDQGCGRFAARLRGTLGRGSGTPSRRALRKVSPKFRQRTDVPKAWLPPTKFRAEIWGVSHRHRPLRNEAGSCRECRGSALSAGIVAGQIRVLPDD